ncbi:MAG TPA: sigma-70 family RNA polymerase sigma factor [Puia sp.]|jgi:RNA polymerase sigma-70 factor (ECF subfamily)|nr:sigma-70 family RNA polymerase sigma factor [Puia sp.]
MQEKELLPHLFRTEYRKIISVLVRHFGFEQFAFAEDIASDTFLIAAETWGLKGLPENPVGWLYTVAKNKARDLVKRNAIFQHKVRVAVISDEKSDPETDIDLSEENIKDSQLQMMFAIADPILSMESQIALILRILCGFGIEEIADAFLTNKETIHKRLTRAKEKIRSAQIKIILPSSGEINQRVDAVLTSLYLLFNEGYYSSNHDSVLRKDFCLEAMRLTLLLIENEKTNKPSVDALFALMCFHSSRFDARVDDKGEIIRYEEQNVELWNEELILKGHYYLNKASRGKELSSYHIEAAIGYWHTIKDDSTEKWDNILQLYNQLLFIRYSPVTALNRTYALSKVKGKTVAIEEAEKLGLTNNHLYHVLLGYLFTGSENTKAVRHLKTALKLAKTDRERNLIRKDLKKVWEYGSMGV